MVESIAARARQLVSGSVSDLVNRLDSSQAERRLQETLHEIEQVMDDARRAAGYAAATRLQALRQAQGAREQIAALNSRARDALQQTREDIAQSAIFEQLDLEALLITLADAERDAANAENAVEREIATLYRRRKEIDAALEATAAAHREARTALAPPCNRHDDRSCCSSMAPNGAMPNLRSVAGPQDRSLRQKQVADRLAAMKAAM